MRRRHALAAAMGAGLTGLPPAAAQPEGKVIKLGWLRPNGLPLPRTLLLRADEVIE